MCTNISSRVHGLVKFKMGYKPSDFNRSSLYDRVKKLLVSFEWSDCSFSVSGKNFKAHKLILAISSPVFEAMLYGPLSSNDEIIITDIEPEVFQLLLNYIYTDRVEISSIEEAFELLYASKKYILEHLSAMCIAYIQINISIDNVSTILNYPDYMQDKQLVLSSLKLFCEHPTYLLGENKKSLSPSCMKTFLESDNMNITEKDLIKEVFDWSAQYCELNNIHNTFENRRDLLLNHGLLRLLRFFTLSPDELNEVTQGINNVLLSCEINVIKRALIDRIYDDRKYVYESLCPIMVPRNKLRPQWYHSHRNPVRSVAPTMIDSNNYIVQSRIKSNKSIFVISLCIPSRMAPLLNFHNNFSKVYSENISVSIISEIDNSVVMFTNFMNTAEYGSIINIELPEPCVIQKDKWYRICFAWPQNGTVTNTYGVVFRERFYKDNRIMLEFDDVFYGNNGSFLAGLKYCL